MLLICVGWYYYHLHKYVYIYILILVEFSFYIVYEQILIHFLLNPARNMGHTLMNL
jgi:hypothetical protein